MEEEKFFTDDLGVKFKFALIYMHYGWEEVEFSNNLEELDLFAKNMISDLSGKPLIIVNGKDEILKEYAQKLTTKG